jgi:hypothetical protein
MSRAHFLDSAIVWRLATGGCVAAWRYVSNFQRLSHEPTIQSISLTCHNRWHGRTEARLGFDICKCSWYTWVRTGPLNNVRVFASARSMPAPSRSFGVAGRLGQDATTRFGVDYHASYRSDTVCSRLRCSSLLYLLSTYLAVRRFFSPEHISDLPSFILLSLS